MDKQVCDEAVANVLGFIGFCMTSLSLLFFVYCPVAQAEHHANALSPPDMLGIPA